MSGLGPLKSAHGFFGIFLSRSSKETVAVFGQLPVALLLAMFAIFTELPTLSAFGDCTPGVPLPLDTEPLLLLHFLPVLPGSCFGLWQPTWSQGFGKPPFGQRSSRGIWRQNEDKRGSRNLWNCLRRCQRKRRQRWLSSSSRSLRWCSLLKGLGGAPWTLPWGGVGGGAWVMPCCSC